MGGVRWLVVFAALAGAAGETVLLEEGFEGADWAARGWYDGPDIRVEKTRDGRTCCVWRWRKKGDVLPEGKGGRVRLKPVDSVTLSFAIRHSDNWQWTGVDWHPHMFQFVTTEDPAFVGPAYTHLTLYVEAVGGRPRLAIQDGRNIDETRVGVDLSGVTEKRAVAGGNGASDAHGPGHCYKAGTRHANGKHWQTKEVCFGDRPGPRDKAAWHTVKAHFRLNTVRDGKAVRDGVLQYWFDGVLLIDHKDVVFRTGQHPDMKINQFLMLPYYGPGVPHPQEIWIDDLRIETGGDPSR